MKAVGITEGDQKKNAHFSAIHTGERTKSYGQVSNPTDTTRYARGSSGGTFSELEQTKIAPLASVYKLCVTTCTNSVLETHTHTRVATRFL